MSIQTDDLAPRRRDGNAAADRRVISAAPASPNEEAIERALRPKGLADYVGQAKVREQLEIFIGAARQRGEALGDRRAAADELVAAGTDERHEAAATLLARHGRPRPGALDLDLGAGRSSAQGEGREEKSAVHGRQHSRPIMAG